MSNPYCGLCVHLDAEKKRCKEWRRKLAYSKRTGPVSYTVFEKCGECRAIESLDAEGSTHP